MSTNIPVDCNTDVAREQIRSTRPKRAAASRPWPPRSPSPQQPSKTVAKKVTKRTSVTKTEDKSATKPANKPNVKSTSKSSGPIIAPAPARKTATRSAAQPLSRSAPKPASQSAPKSGSVSAPKTLAKRKLSAESAVEDPPAKRTRRAVSSKTQAETEPSLKPIKSRKEKSSVANNTKAAPTAATKVASGRVTKKKTTSKSHQNSEQPASKSKASSKAKAMPKVKADANTRAASKAKADATLGAVQKHIFNAQESPVIPAQGASSPELASVPKSAPASKRASVQKRTPASNSAATKKQASTAAPAPGPKPSASEEKPKAATKKVKIINKRPTEVSDIYVFGAGDFGELGMGHDDATARNISVARVNPFLSSPNSEIVQVAAGSMHGAALTKDGRLLTWGLNDHGALGRETESSNVDEESGINVAEGTPSQINMSNLPENIEITSIAAGESTTFFVTDNGFVYGCGQYRSATGVLGFCEYDDKKQDQFMKIPTVKNITKVACGANHTLALDTDGNVWCWGAGGKGQLGRRLVERHIKVGLWPTMALFRKKIIDIVAGAYHSFALAADGQVYTWGVNTTAQCGMYTGANGDEAFINVPVVSEPLSEANLKQIAGGLHHSLGVTHDGQVMAWGRCDYGQMGIDINTLPEDQIVQDSTGKNAYITAPAVVPGITARMVEAGCNASFAIDADGACWAWGEGDCCRLGLQTGADQHSPHHVQRATEMADSPALQKRGGRLSWVGAGCQYGMVAGPAA